MKVRELPKGTLIEVGDQIKTESAFGISWNAVHRVTPKFAFVKWNEHAEGKFPRAANEFGFCSLPRERWRTTQYSAWRPAETATGTDLTTE